MFLVCGGSNRMGFGPATFSSKLWGCCKPSSSSREGIFSDAFETQKPPTGCVGAEDHGLPERGSKEDVG